MTHSESFDERCYRLRYVEELTIREVARRMKSNTNAVRRALKREHRRVAPDTRLPSIRCGRALEGQMRAAKAFRMLERGEPTDRILEQTGYESRECLWEAVARHRAKTGAGRAGRDYGEHVVQKKKGYATLVVSRKAIRRAGWKAGDMIRWRTEDGTLVLFPAETIPSIPKTGDKGADAYYFRFREHKSWVEVGKTIGMSASGACNAAKTFAHDRGLPWLVKAKSGATEGVVHVVYIKDFDGFAVTLVTPVGTLGWQPGELIGWRFEKPARIRFSRKTPLAQAS